MNPEALVFIMTFSAQLYDRLLFDPTQIGELKKASLWVSRSATFLDQAILRCWTIIKDVSVPNPISKTANHSFLFDGPPMKTALG